MAQRLRRKLNAYANRLVFGSAGRWLNLLNLPYRLEYRPDYHVYDQQIPQYSVLQKAWLAGNGTNNGGDFTRFYMLYQNIRQILKDGVEGDFIELGVYKGNSATMLAALGRTAGRQTYLLDTFEGFDARDFRGDDAGRQMQFKDTSLERVRALVGEDRVTYIKGFFPESVKGLALPERLALAHIDCDLYDPMKAALESFYPRLSRGGLLIMHDYGSGHWRGATRAVDEFFADKPEKPIIMPDKSGSAVIRRV